MNNSSQPGNQPGFFMQPTSGNPGGEDIMYEVNMDLMATYNKVSYLNTFQSRAAEGNRGNLSEAGDGWLLKSDKMGEDGVSWEYQVYAHIQAQGLDVAPECAVEEGVFGYPSTILIRKVNNGATLRDYIEAYLDGIIAKEPLLQLSLATSELLRDFWEAGYTHRDLHARNIVVGLNRLGKGWRPYLIDFSSSTHESQEEEFAYKEATIRAEMSSQADDWETLQEEILILARNPEDLYEFLSILGTYISF